MWKVRIIDDDTSGNNVAFDTLILSDDVRISSALRARMVGSKWYDRACC